MKTSGTLEELETLKSRLLEGLSAIEKTIELLRGLTPDNAIRRGIASQKKNKGDSMHERVILATLSLIDERGGPSRTLKIPLLKILILLPRVIRLKIQLPVKFAHFE